MTNKTSVRRIAIFVVSRMETSQVDISAETTGRSFFVHGRDEQNLKECCAAVKKCEKSVKWILCCKKLAGNTKTRRAGTAGWGQRQRLEVSLGIV